MDEHAREVIQREYLAGNTGHTTFRVWEAVYRLPEESRNAVRLKIAGWSREAVASALRKSPAEIETIWAEADKKIRDDLARPRESDPAAQASLEAPATPTFEKSKPALEKAIQEALSTPEREAKEPDWLNRYLEPHGSKKSEAELWTFIDAMVARGELDPLKALVLRARRAGIRPNEIAKLIEAPNAQWVKNLLTRTKQLILTALDKSPS